jgi:hypothetical protein
VNIVPGGSERGERAKVHRYLTKLEAECLAKRYVAFNVGD